MRFQFSLAELLALTTIVSVGVGLCPLWKSSLLATGVSVSLLVGSIVGCVIGFCYGRVRWAVVWGILSALLGTAGWLVTYVKDGQLYNPSWPISFVLVALVVSVPSASVAAVFNRRHRELLIWPSVNCFAAIAILGLIVITLLMGGAAISWANDQPWQGPAFMEIAATIPSVFLASVITSIAWGVTFGSLGLSIKGILFLEALGRNSRQPPQ